MDESADTRQRLSDRINQKQQAIRSYLGRERPRRNRLSNISIVGSALAAMLTAGPAVGGTGFTEAVQGIFSLGDDSIVWRFLCLAAVVLSVAAALATNFPLIYPCPKVRVRSRHFEAPRCRILDPPSHAWEEISLFVKEFGLVVTGVLHPVHPAVAALNPARQAWVP
jgi:MFS family permease